MTQLVWFTICACLQIPLMTLWTYLFVCKRKKSEASGAGMAWWVMAWMPTFLCLGFAGLDLLWSSVLRSTAYIISVVAIIICSVISLFLAAFVCYIVPKNKSLDHQNTAKGTFYAMIVYDISLIAGTCWFFFSLIPNL